MPCAGKNKWDWWRYVIHFVTCCTAVYYQLITPIFDLRKYCYVISASVSCVFRYIVQWSNKCTISSRNNLTEMTKNIHWFVPLLYSIYWLLHVSAVACHHQGASYILDPSELLEIQIEWVVYNIMWGYVAGVQGPIWFVLQVTQKDLRSSLMMAGYCRNM
jgi:hypothetical protein